MSAWNKNLYKHLETIRQELNTYIELHSPKGAAKFSTATVTGVSEQKKRGGVQDKFLNCMKLNDIWEEDASEIDELPDEEIVLSPEGSLGEDTVTNKPSQSQKTPAPVITPAPSAPQMSVMLQRPSTSKSASVPRKPEFLRKRDQDVELDKVLEQKAETFSTMLLRLIDEKGLKDSEVYKKANIDRRLFSKIRGDEDYVPSKKTAISFCLALQLEMNESRKLLETAGYALSASSRFDLIIMYLIEHKEFNIQFVNIVLDDYGEGTLSK